MYYYMAWYSFGRPTFMCVCFIEIAGCHAVSHPMISDINNRRSPAPFVSDSRRPAV